MLLSSTYAFPEWLKEYQDCVESELASQLAKPSSKLEAIAYGAIGGGKRLRAILALLWCEAICGDYTRASEIAVAYELAHSAALIQDDVIDRSAMRRGEASLPGKYGPSNAILAANALLFYVPKVISEFTRKSNDPALVAKILDLFGECYRSSSLGEYLDLEMVNSPIVSEKDYETMIRLKTGSLIGAASASGALIGGGDSATVAAAYEYGTSVGVAYQTQDDVLDIFGDERTIGKPTFNDIANGKKSLMIIRFFAECDVASELHFVNSLLNAKTDSITTEENSRLRELLLKYGCLTYAKNFAARYVQASRASLETLSDSPARERLIELSILLSIR
jgi:geranylgeranyl pyrophosphate synthase